MKKRLLGIFSLLLAIVTLTSCDGYKTARTKKITNEITQTPVILESVLTEQPDFVEFLNDFKSSYVIPGLLEGVIPQGFCYDETTGYFLISGYYEKEKFPSVIMAIDAKNGDFVGAYPLKTTNGADYCGHAGGIAASQNTVYLTSEGQCYTFPSTLLKTLENGDTLQFQSKFKLNTAGSFACINANTLWIGNFIENNDKVKNDVKDITTLENGETFYAYCEGYVLVDGLPSIKQINSDSSGYVPDYVLAIPDQVQGMAFTKTNKIIFSTSYGRKNNSKLYIYEDIFLNEKSGTKIIDGKEVDLYACSSKYLEKEIVAPPMSEGMATNNDGIYLIFESGAERYRSRRGKHPTDTIFVSNIE